MPSSLIPAADRKTLWLFYGLPVASVVAGLVLGTGYPGQWPFHGVLERLGDALAIAGLLALFFEVAAQKRLIEHTAEHLAGRLIGRGLPRPLQESISKLVLKTDFVMFDYLKAYRFMPCDDVGSFDIEITTTYAVENYSDATAEYTPSSSEEIIYAPRFVRLEYGCGADAHALGPEQLAEIAKPDKNGRALKVEGPQKVKLRSFRDASSIGPDRCQVLFRHCVRMRNEYTDVASFGRAAVGGSIRFDAVPAGFEALADGPEMQHEAGSTTWRSSAAFMIGQHMRAWWFRRPS